MSIEYVTTRELENKNGKLAGKIRVLKLVGEGYASVNLKCPECSFEDGRKENWSEPFVVGSGKKQSFNVKCKCGYKVKLSKLKKEIKKKK